MNSLFNWLDMLSRNHTVKAVAAIVEARDPPSANSVQAVQKQFNVFVYFNYKKRIVILVKNHI